MHLVISPHLDDAVFSLGGLLSLWRRQRKETCVWTLFSGDGEVCPELKPVFNSLAGPERSALRREQDCAALALLGTDCDQEGLPDALFRRDHQGHRYTKISELFGPIHPADGDIREQIEKRMAPRLSALSARDTVFLPAGCGNHVDHLLVRDVARLIVASLGLNHFYYLECPYGRGNQRHRHFFAQEDWQKKLAAAALYREQIELIWGSQAQMIEALEGFYLTSEGHAEYIHHDYAELLMPESS